MKRKKNTRLVHQGINRSIFSETSEPIFMTSGFIYENAKEAEYAFQDKKKDLYTQDMGILQLVYLKKGSHQ